MLINCVAYQDGHKLVDMASEDSSNWLKKPEASSGWRRAAAPTPTWRNRNNQHFLGLRERCERQPQLLNWRLRRAAWL